jgi:molybdenum cofactor cytidylyltransferase
MILSEALRIGKIPRLAFVGAGGKTTAIFQLAHQLEPPVIVTATTHLATWQVKLADQHILIRNELDLSETRGEELSGVVLVTGEQVEPDRVSGIGFREFSQLISLADEYQIPVLVEADGSRQLPMKAPADHEPAIPPHIETVVVVCGLAALGKPLGPEWAHRTERFASISGISGGENISIQAVAQVMLDPVGGLKNIPTGVRQVALLNQADSLELQSAANALAKKLLPHYHAVLISALKPDDPSGSAAQGVPQVYAVHESIAGVVLAAGGSSRLRKPKQLLTWKGKPFVRTVASKALETSLRPVIVVTGANAQDVERALEGLPVIIVRNSDWEAGQSTSIQKGLRALPGETGGALFLLSDQPQVSPTLIRKLVEFHAQTLSPIVAPLIDGERGNPVLFDRRTFPDFFDLEGDMGGRKLFSRFKVSWVDWHDRNLLLDVDTEEDYQRLLDIED